MSPRIGFSIAVAIALSVLPACTMSPAGFHEGIVKDLDTGAPLADVMVVGVFGYRVNVIEGDRFVCQGVQLVTSDAAGRYAFSRAQLPAFQSAYRAGYWEKWLPSEQWPRPFGMTRRNPIEDLAPSVREQHEKLGRSPLAERFADAGQAMGRCPELSDDTRPLKSLYIAMAHEALESAQTDSDRSLALRTCRLVAAENDNGGRGAMTLAGRFVFTQLEASRLKQAIPECLSPPLLVWGMRDLLRDSTRKKIPSDDELLARAIIDPAAYQRILASRSMSQSSGPYALSEPFGCYIEVGVAERRSEFEENVRDAGIAFKRDDRKTGIWVNCRDRDKATKIGHEAMSDF